MDTQTADYTVLLNTGTATTTSQNFSIGSTHYCISSCNHWSTPYTYWYGTPTTIYKYQVKCPKCKAKNWLELDTVTPCSKCSSTLKAVSKSVDYEIEIDE